MSGANTDRARRAGLLFAAGAGERLLIALAISAAIWCLIGWALA